jgi:hypothetical protein
MLPKACAEAAAAGESEEDRKRSGAKAMATRAEELAMDQEHLMTYFRPTSKE